MIVVKYNFIVILLFQNEYISACDERRAFITGFTGSAGVALITQTEALLWTDGRYFIQAEQQLDENWTQMKMGISILQIINIKCFTVL